MSHILNVLTLDEEGYPDEMSVDGRHDEFCQVWENCGKPECESFDFNSDEAFEGVLLHGVEHKMIDDYFMRLTDDCAVLGSDSSIETAREIGREHGLGSYRVGVDYEGEGCWYTYYIGPVEVDK
jgi:hypothetical protein